MQAGDGARGEGTAGSDDAAGEAHGGVSGAAPPDSPALAFEDVACTFVSRDDPGQRYAALRGVTLRMAPGEFVSVVGPTGCGKWSATESSEAYPRRARAARRCRCEETSTTAIQTSTDRAGAAAVTVARRQLVRGAPRATVAACAGERHPIPAITEP